ncbi:Protein F18F11.1 [Aphelenchoides avenae]|nr:Protein F18F11.1 [Aphelenchus avenae]
MRKPSQIHILRQLEPHRHLLAAIKGLRNGLVYGTRIRAPHALVMVFLFGQGRFWTKVRTVLTLTKIHALNLGRFVFGYKVLMGLLQQYSTKYRHWHPFVSAFLNGYLVFGEENGVNTQINLYLLSRIIYGLVKLAAEKRFIPTPSFPVFPWFAAFVWGIVLWMFENYQHVLQGSLQSSMTYLYHDSNVWTNIRDFLIRIK